MQSTYLKSKFKIKIHVLLSLLHKDLKTKKSNIFWSTNRIICSGLQEWFKVHLNPPTYGCKGRMFSYDCVNSVSLYFL